MTDERYDQIKDYAHPKMHTFVEHYRCEHLINLPPYHECNATNKNGTRKPTQYKIAEECVSPTWNVIERNHLKSNLNIRKRLVSFIGHDI